MHRAFLSLAVSASILGFAGQARANLIGLGHKHQDEKSCSIELLKSDKPDNSGKDCRDESPKQKWSILEDCKHKEIHWKDLGKFDLPKDDKNCHYDDRGDGPCDHDGCDNDPSITPSVTPSGSGVPLPPAVWGGLATLVGAAGVAKGRKPAKA